MNYKKFVITALATLTFGSILLNSCGKPDEHNNGEESKGIEIAVENPVRTKLTEYTDLNANTAYLKQEIVRATFQGYIDKAFKNIGDKVKQGDVLFLIRTKEADATINLSDSGVRKFDGSVKVTARTDGIITQLDHQTGDYVADGDQLAMIVDPQSLRIMLEVPFEYSSSINSNDLFTIQLPDGKDFNARVDKKIPSIDPSAQTQKYILKVDSQLDLPANLNVNVKVPVKSINDALAVPKAAVMTNETQTEFWIMKMMNDSTAVRENIKKGIETDSLVQVVDPKINLNDRFITEGAYGLPDTAKVFIQTKTGGAAKTK